MSDLIFALISVIIGLTILAAVGHFLWLLGAAAFRAIFGSADVKPLAPPRRCPSCGAALGLSATQCRSCGFRVREPANARLLADLDGMKRQVKRLFQRGLLSDEQQAELLKTVDAEKARLTGKQPDGIRQQPDARPETQPLGKPAEPVETGPSRPAVKQPVTQPAAAEAVTEPTPSESLEIHEFLEPAAEVQSRQPPAEPPRPFTDLLQAFMEEKNIRWGELISGMLIVGSAIGLVISLWSTLENVPYFAPLLFMLVTASIHGAGMYTLRRWKLETTSQGLLTIATLLIPLNFLAAIAMSHVDPSRQRPLTDPLYVAAVVIGLTTFGAITVTASRVLVPQAWWLFSIAVMGASAGQLLISRQQGPWPAILFVNVLAGIPIASYLTATVGQFWMATRWKEPNRQQITEMFLLLGAASFSLLMPVGLILWKSGAVRETLAQLSPSLTLAAVPILGLGLTVHRRVTSDEMAATRTAGTSVALVGASLMLTALVLAWPRPELLLAVGLVNFVALTLVALVAGFPILHVSAVGSFALAYLVGFHLVQGQFAGQERVLSGQLLQTLLMGRSGVALTVLAALTGCVAWLFQRAKRRDDAISYLTSTAGLAGMSILIAAYSGFWYPVDSELATPIFGIYAAVLLTANLRIQRAAVAWGGSALLLATFIHGLVWNEKVAVFLKRFSLMPDRPAVIAMLLHASVVCLVAITVSARHQLNEESDSRKSLRTGFRFPLSVSGLISSALVVPVILFWHRQQFDAHALYAIWVAAIWLALSVMHGSRLLFAAAQSIATVAICFGVTAVCQQQPWWGRSFFDPRHVQAQLTVLAVWSMSWVPVRKFLQGKPIASALLETDRVSVDRIVLGATVAGSIMLAILGCGPGVSGEFESIGSVSDIGSFRSLMLLGAFLIGLGALWTASIADFREFAEGRFLVAAFIFGAILLPMWDLTVEQIWTRINVDHRLAYGNGAWMAVGLVTLALVVTFLERPSPIPLIGLCLTLFTVPLLVAGHFELQHAAASALRWGLAVYGAIAAATVCARRRLQTLAQRLGWRSGNPSNRLAETVRSLTLGLSALPILALTFRYAVAIAVGDDFSGPEPASIFTRMGPSVSYALPLVILTAIMVGYAIREKSPSFALAGSFLLNIAVSLAYVLPLWIDNAQPESAVLVQFVQWNGLALAIYSLVWLAARRWIEPEMGTAETDSTVAATSRKLSQLRISDLHSISPLGYQLGLAQAVAAVLAVWAAVAIFWVPGRLPQPVQTLGHVLGHLAVLLTAVASIWYARDRWPGSAVDGAAAGGLALLALVAASTYPSNSPDNWFTYHVLTVGWLVLAGLATGIACFTAYVTELHNRSQPEESETPHDDSSMLDDRFVLVCSRIIDPAARWATFVIGLIVVLAIRAEWSDPTRPWYSMGSTGVAALLAAMLAMSRRSQPYAYGSVVLALLATTFVWLQPWLGLGQAASPQAWVNLVEANLVAVTLAGLFWLGVELSWQHKADSAFDPDFASPPVQHSAAGLALIVGGLLSVVCLVDQTTELRAGTAAIVDVSHFGGWLMLACTTLLLVGSLWDRTARHAVPGLYAVGLIALTIVLDSLELIPRHLLFGIAVAATGYVLVTGLLWRFADRTADWAARFALPVADRVSSRSSIWLPVVNLVLAVAVVAIEFWVVLTFQEQPLRLWGAMAVALLVPGIAALAHQQRQQTFQLLALIFATVAAVDFGWAIMPVADESYFWLQRAIRLMVVLAFMTFVYGVVLVRALPAAGDWFASARRAATMTGGASLLSLLVVLAMEAVWYQPGVGAPVTRLQIAVVAVVLVGLAAALISLAVLPGRDPLNLSERGRMAYVYTAEVVLSLLFLHIYLTMPELFRGYLRPYWPLIVMAIAFFGAGAGEFFRRSQLPVLAEPLQRSGAFLPLVPALGFWIFSSRSELSSHYSTELFVAGLVYVFLSMSRKSFVYGLSAALAGNAGLWALWHEHGQSLLAHPQLWLIPPALSVLVAAQLNRRQLGEARLSTIRYMCVTVIYVSSSGEMFIRGVADSLWLPMVLATFSVIGVFAGIALRVRAFLYLGSSFLLLSIVSMVWHAAERIDHNWPWWLFGIALGIAILIVFGLFEKKRQEMLEVISELREWER